MYFSGKPTGEKPMASAKSINPWVVVIIILAVVIITGGAVILGRYTPARPLEITLEEPPAAAGEIAIGGEVANPGSYPLREGDTVADLLRAAGGVTDATAELELNALTPEATPQRVDINRAEPWLLAALPGIGETKARDIVAYREQHGAFRSVDELAKVDGIGATTVDSLRHLITVAD